MEAPEKIYLFKNPITETPDERWLTHRSCEEDIEYTRTDAFIEKALEWIKEVIRPYYHDVRYKYEDFRNYMKGE